MRFIRRLTPSPPLEVSVTGIGPPQEAPHLSSFLITSDSTSFFPLGPLKEIALSSFLLSFRR